MPNRVQQLESRVACLERELRELKARINVKARVPWYEQIVGVFKGDSDYAEITRLGRAIRRADRRRSR